MSTEDQRRRNREKQARFAARNPGYSKKYRPKTLAKLREKNRLKKLVQVVECSGKYRVFVLADPREPSLPRVVGVCKSGSLPWVTMWGLKGVCKSPWAAWFIEMDKLGLTPVDISQLKTPMGYSVALRIAKTKSKALVAIEGSASWFYNLYPHRRKVGRVCGDCVEDFYSATSAAQKLGLWQQEISKAANTFESYNGWTWFNNNTK